LSIKVVLLGTDGGPRTKVGRNASANLVIHDNNLYVVDSGNGVARQIVRAGYDLHKLRASFITHHHSDHNADYGTLLLLAWASGLITEVNTFGPPPLQSITDLFFAMSKVDIDVRMADEGRPPLRSLVCCHEIESPGILLEEQGLRISATLVDHPPLRHAFAYRFDTDERSIVFSGDTCYSPELIEFAKGADTLVHEVILVDALQSTLVNNNAERLIDHLLASHTPADSAGKIAAEAGVDTLVLTHCVPGSSVVSDHVWQEEAAKEFSGRIVVGHDLMVV